MAAALALILSAAPSSVVHAQVQPCDVPDVITVAGLEIEAVNPTVQLSPVDFPTTLRWAVALLLPNLAKDEVGIYLYDLASFSEANNSLNDRHVLLFIVCNQGNSYWAKLGRIRSNSGDDPQVLNPGINQNQPYIDILNDADRAWQEFTRQQELLSLQQDVQSDRLYLGTTIPVPRSSSGPGASEIMRGDLRSFPSISGMQAP